MQITEHWIYCVCVCVSVMSPVTTSQGLSCRVRQLVKWIAILAPLREAQAPGTKEFNKSASLSREKENDWWNMRDKKELGEIVSVYELWWHTCFTHLHPGCRKQGRGSQGSMPPPAKRSDWKLIFGGCKGFIKFTFWPISLSDPRAWHPGTDGARASPAWCPLREREGEENHITKKKEWGDRKMFRVQINSLCYVRSFTKFDSVKRNEWIQQTLFHRKHQSFLKIYNHLIIIVFIYLFITHLSI